MDEMVKYIAVNRFYHLDINEDRFITNKSYREEKIKEGIFNDYLKKFDKERLEIGGYKFIDNNLDIEFKLKLSKKDNNNNNNDSSIAALDEEIPAVINDNEFNVTEKPESDNQKKYKRMLTYLLIIQYYNLNINMNKFVTDESYMEEKIKEESFKESLKRFDEEEKVEIEGFERIGKELRIKYKGELSRKGNNDDNVINNSITAITKEIPAVINNNEVKVTESEVKMKKEKKKKEEKVKRKRPDEDQQIIQNSIALANEEIPPVVNNAIDDGDVIVLPTAKLPSVFIDKSGRKYRLRKKTEVKFEISSEEGGIKNEDEYVNVTEDKVEDNGEGEDEGEDEGDGEADDEAGGVDKNDEDEGNKKYRKNVTDM
jgi:hypothetical protein